MTLGVVRASSMSTTRGLLCSTRGDGAVWRRDMWQASRQVLTETDWTGAICANSVSLSTGEYHSPQESITLHRRVSSGRHPSLNCVPEHYKPNVLHTGRQSRQSQVAAANQEGRIQIATPRLRCSQALRLKSTYRASKGHANPQLPNISTTADVRGSRRLRPLHYDKHLSDWRQQNRMLYYRWHLGNVSRHINQARPGSISDHMLSRAQA